ncbi:hypothetical protein ACJIZ3_016257 [Penstemon smallii]|uniref:Uncharacterized protein n=1 Tax=Penstemon smallii TaxID=265156 RepID=A0ABD3RPW0_9LAMI
MSSLGSSIPNQLPNLEWQTVVHPETKNLENKDCEKKVTEVEEKYFETTKSSFIKENENIKLSQDNKAINIGEKATDDKTYKRWNLRDRKSIRLPKSANEKWEENDKQPTVTKKSGKGKTVKEEDKNKPQLPNFTLALKLEEISEDIFAMTGNLPSKKMRTRSKNVQRNIDLIYPGGSLEVITVHKYKVSENTRKAKYTY